MISFEHPGILFAALILIPALFFLASRIGSITRTLSMISANRKTNSVIRRIKRALTIKFTLRSFAVISLTLAAAGISWGTKLVPVQKSGDALCLVFDISYSMNATDMADSRTSRLEAARLYADALIQRLQGTSVAVVLAKGDGIIALPLTEDYAAITTLLENLSPHLMSSAGSSIGKGIRAALSAFPPFSAQAAHIWVFTDGDETDGSLAAALDDSVRYGTPVTFIGFGSTQGADILAGDGKTTVHTVLQEERLQEACRQANKKRIARKSTTPLISYENALSAGAAHRLLEELGKENTIYAYEVQPISRRTTFILIALLLFILSFIAGEFDASYIKRFFATALCLTPLLFTSCKASQQLHVLEAAWKWYQKRYHQATADFLHAQQEAKQTQEAVIESYAVFGLAATYIMQEEYDAAQEKLESIDILSPDCPDKLKSAVYYNLGIIEHQKGLYDEAAAYFKKAVIADNSNTDAKINLELTEFRLHASNTKASETEMQQVGESKEDSALKKGIFNLIKEQEQEQWKKLQSNQKKSDSVDY
ncbi:MAG: VWA domain-containing protein [Treponema sp.]|nr:VWA domain-containing protein [Treponema sp.]